MLMDLPMSPVLSDNYPQTDYLSTVPSWLSSLKKWESPLFRRLLFRPFMMRTSGNNLTLIELEL